MKIRTDHVTVFIIRRVSDEFEFLQLRRAQNDYLGGTWQTMRGSAETGETATQTALRELKEETGLSPKEFYALGVVETFYIAASDTTFHSATFVAIVDPQAKITLDAEHDEYRWIRAADAEHKFMWPSESPLIREIHSKILRDSDAKPLLRIS